MGQNIGVTTATTTTHGMFAAKLRKVSIHPKQMFKKSALGAEIIISSYDSVPEALVP